jgi:signal transduction histidine kinase
MVNAFRHAQAHTIEVDIFYDRTALRLTLRDDGSGIDAAVLRSGGREGHYGLLGMRERAKRIRAQLQIWSRADAGTEIELRVPADMAYVRMQRSRWYTLWKKVTS